MSVVLPASGCEMIAKVRRSRHLVLNRHVPSTPSSLRRLVDAQLRALRRLANQRERALPRDKNARAAGFAAGRFPAARMLRRRRCECCNRRRPASPALPRASAPGGQMRPDVRLRAVRLRRLVKHSGSAESAHGASPLKRARRRRRSRSPRRRFRRHARVDRGDLDANQVAIHPARHDDRNAKNNQRGEHEITRHRCVRKALRLATRTLVAHLRVGSCSATFPQHQGKTPSCLLRKSWRPRCEA